MSHIITFLAAALSLADDPGLADADADADADDPHPAAAAPADAGAAARPLGHAARDSAASPALGPTPLTTESAQHLVRAALLSVEEPLEIVHALDCAEPAVRCALETTQPDNARLADLLEAVQAAALGQGIAARAYLVGIESDDAGRKTGEIMLFPEPGRPERDR